MMKSRLRLCLALAALFLSGVLIVDGAPNKETKPVDFTIQLDVISSGFDGKMCWVHPRSGAIPGNPPLVVLTLQKLLLSGSDIFYGLHSMHTADRGLTWSEPAKQNGFKRKIEENDVEAVVCDFTPKWHAQTKTLLGTGHIARYHNNHLVRDHRRGVSYAVFDETNRTWKPWRTMEMPNESVFYNSGAGSTQRYDLANGEILLPVYTKAKGDNIASTVVFRCRFDGEALSAVEYGDILRIPVPRGFGEPSIAKFGNRFFLTLRNDEAGYVTSGKDGLHYDTPIQWCFDDGEELGNYNTQQHWVIHPREKALYLVYTRKGANNDRVFRHRAPLFIAQVDVERLCVIRDTERILVPEYGARLGNFGVVEVDERETWVTVAEWMQPLGCERHGSDNRVYAARIQWSDTDGQ